jgi:hypothetical protein
MQDFQGLVDEASALLGAPATLEDRDFTLIASSAQDGALDPVRTSSILSRRSSAEVRAWFERFGIAEAVAPVRTPADPETGILPRLCLPLRHDGLTYGYLWLLDGGSFSTSDPQIAAAMKIANQAAELLAASAAPARAFELLLSDSARDRAEGERTLAESGHPAATSPITVAVLRDGTGLRPSGVIAHRASGGLALLIPLRDPADLTPARTAVTRALPSSALAGIGGARTNHKEIRESWQEAKASLRSATAFPHLGPVACWHDLGVYRLLVSLRASKPGAEPAESALLPLLDPVQAELLRTAETYLDLAGHAQQTAAVLTIHRQTLYYRLSRIETLTGLNLNSGEDRLLLHITLKAFRLASTTD